MLEQITITDDTLRAALLADSEWDWDEYESYDYDCDPLFIAAVDVLNTILGERPANGRREYIIMTLDADTDGGVGGYSFLYDLSAPDLRLASSYVEWRHARGDMDGIDGIIDFLNNVLRHVNRVIEGYNANVALELAGAR